MLQQHHGGAGKAPQRRRQGADGSEAESLLASQEAKVRLSAPPHQKKLSKTALTR